MIRLLLLCGALGTLLLAGGNPVSAETQDKVRRESLAAVYFLSIAADRCGFSFSRREADAIDRASTRLEKELELSSDDADALYSQVDRRFEKLGEKACEAGGETEQAFRETLRKLTEQ